MAEAARETRTGELLNEAYELHELLEKGGTYDVYRATDHKSRRTVRVKLLRPEFALQSKVVQGFLGAPRSLSGLRHPNVSQVLAVESDETGIPFVVEEHVEGEPLARTIERFPDGMPLGVAITLLLPVVEAVAAAHALGVAHGRIDRDHVLLAKLGGTSVPKVVRFGSAATPAGADAARRGRLAPELRDGKAAADLRSDVWAIGALLYETLCGERPPERGAHTPLDERVPHVPAELAAIVERCLSNAPARRPERASAVRDVLSATRDRMRPAETKSKARAADGAVAASRSRSSVADGAETRSKPPQGAPSHLRARPRAGVGRNTAIARQVALPALETAAPTATADPLATTAPGDSGLGRAQTDPDVARSGAHAAEDGDLDLSFDATFASEGDSAFARSATVMAQRPSAPRGDEVLAFPRADAADAAAQRETAIDESDDDPVLELTSDGEVDGDDDGPEITLEAAASLAPRARPRTSAPPAVEIKTMSDLAAAFGPIEGEDRIGQASAAAADTALDDDAAAADTRGKPGKDKDKDKNKSKDRSKGKNRNQLEAKPPAKSKHSDKDGDKPAALLSRKALVQKNTPPARALSEEQARQLRERTQQGERRGRRYLSAILFFLFAFGLLFAVPLLVDPTRSKAQELFGARTQLAIAGFTVLTIVALVRTWALQISARPVMLRPVTILLKVVAATVCLLAVSFFLPSGALGPAEVAARGILPWAAAGFYLFLTLHGLMKGVREVSTNALYGIAIVMLYGGGLFGSYRVLATTVLSKQGGAASAVAGLKTVKGKDSAASLADYVGGKVKIDADAGAGDKITDRNTVGASEADDMRNIEEMEQSRKRKGAQFDDLGKKVDDFMH